MFILRCCQVTYSLTSLPSTSIAFSLSDFSFSAIISCTSSSLSSVADFISLNSSARIPPLAPALLTCVTVSLLPSLLTVCVCFITSLGKFKFKFAI
nr:MAG TPA: hypothetical protein [Caudoviricetes sp.]